jgi:hypothetical protein
VTEPGLVESSCRGSCFVLGQSGDAGQVRPLIVERFERRRVQENRGAVQSALSVQRCRDQVANTPTDVHVLGREQPVVAGQAHRPTQLDRFADQARRYPARERGGRGLRKKDPDMSAPSGLRHLQRRWNSVGTCGFHIGERVEHRGILVEVGGNPPAAVVIGQRIHADVLIAA